MKKILITFGLMVFVIVCLTASAGKYEPASVVETETITIIALEGRIEALEDMLERIENKIDRLENKLEILDYSIYKSGQEVIDKIEDVESPVKALR